MSDDSDFEFPSLDVAIMMSKEEHTAKLSTEQEEQFEPWYTLTVKSVYIMVTLGTQQSSFYRQSPFYRGCFAWIIAGLNLHYCMAIILVSCLCSDHYRHVGFTVFVLVELFINVIFL